MADNNAVLSETARAGDGVDIICISNSFGILVFMPSVIIYWRHKWEAIKFEQVTFTYPLAEQAALKDVTFEMGITIYCDLREVGL